MNDDFCDNDYDMDMSNDADEHPVTTVQRLHVFSEEMTGTRPICASSEDR